MYHDLLAWGEALKYSSIVLRRDPKDILPAGRDAWQALLSSSDVERIVRLQERREYWRRTREAVSSADACQDTTTFV